MKYFLSILALVLSFGTFGQTGCPAPICGDPSVITYSDPVTCASTCATLHACVTGETPTSAGITLDDIYSGVIPIGFTFNYYGTAYTTCVIGSNGMITFNNALAGTYCPWPITAVLLGNPSALNTICGPWCDIDPSLGGTVTYATSGTAPNRRFTATWCEVPMYNTSYCPDHTTTTQIILYESCDLVDVHVTNKTICTAWNGGYAIIGVQDATGTNATVAPGRDFPATYTCTNEAWRFTPGGAYTVAAIPYHPVPLAASTINWYPGASGGAVIGTGATLNCVTIPGTYRAEVAGCNTISTSIITVVPPIAGVVFDTICVCEGVTRLLPTYPPGGFWAGGPPAIAVINPLPPPGTVTGLMVGTAVYIYTIPGGCTYNLTIKVVDCCCFDEHEDDCVDTCYWTVSGNNINPGRNLFGTLSNDDIRIITNNTQRSVIQAGGNMGIRQLFPTTTFNVDCIPVTAPSGLRFENLPFGHGNILVVDPMGYVFQMPPGPDGAMRPAGNGDLQDQINILKQQIEELKAQLGSTTGVVADNPGNSFTVTPNPSNGQINVSYTIGGTYNNATIKITDIAGRLISSKPVTNNTGTSTFNLAASAASGEIIVSMVVDGKSVARQKVIVVK